MIELTCFDEQNNIIASLTQWDIEQFIKIKDIDIALNEAPYFHFCNKNSDKALIVRSEMQDDEIVVKIPNILLREPYKIFAYMYVYSSQISAKALAIAKIPINPRVKPDDYILVDSKDYVTFEELREDISNAVTSCNAYSENIKAEAISIAINEGTRITDEHISTHNEDTTAHEDMRSAIYGQVANMIDMDVYEHDTNSSAHEDIRNSVGNAVSTCINKLYEHNTDTTAHQNMRSAIYGQVANMIDMDVYEHDTNSSAHEDIRQLIDNSAGKIDADSKLLTGEIFNNYTDNHALGSNSHAEGDQNTASGDNSHTEGYNNVAGGAHSHAEGSSNTIDSGTAAHVEGGKNTISATYTHAEGYGNNITAGGGYSHAEGRDNTVNGGYQHIEGRGNSSTTNELYQHIQGKFADATQTGLAHIVGNGSSATALSNAHTLDWNGNAWFGGDVFVGEQYHKLLHGESGVCTLTNSDGTATINGNYYVIGDLVTVWISGVLSDSSDWNDTWSGLPFASKLTFDGVSYTQSFDSPLCYTLKSRHINGSVIAASLDISNSISIGHNISFTYVKY